MAVEEPKKVEVEPECPPEPPVAAATAATAAAEEEEEKALVPVEVSEEKPTDDTKALIVVESKLI